MISIDMSGIQQLAKKYEVRAANCRTKGVQGIQEQLTNNIDKVFLQMLLAGENITLQSQREFYKQTKTGYYGSASEGHQMEMINPQEKIDPGSRIEGKGRMYADRGYQFLNAGMTDFALYTDAKMKPYAEGLPELPLAQYMRTGWRNPAHPKHHMKPRPFGNVLARTINALRLFAKLNAPLLTSWGFKRK